MALSHSPSIVTDGLVLCLDAANRKSYPGTGTGWNNITGLTSGILLNGVTFSNSNNGVLVFDGTDDYVNVPSLFDFSITNEITASIWCQSATETWDDTAMLISKRNQFIIHPEAGSKQVTFYVRISTDAWNSISYIPTTITNYNNYVLNYNKGDFRIFFNGVSVASNTILSTLLSDTGDTTIGNDDGISRYLNGRVANVMIYNKALNAQQILENFNALRGRFGI